MLGLCAAVVNLAQGFLAARIECDSGGGWVRVNVNCVGSLLDRIPETGRVGIIAEIRDFPVEVCI
jgi:hypothetical protein